MEKNTPAKRNLELIVLWTNSLTSHLNNNYIIAERPRTKWHICTFHLKRLWPTTRSWCACPVSMVELCEIMFTEELIELFMCVIEDRIACKTTTMPTNGNTFNSAKRRAHTMLAQYYFLLFLNWYGHSFRLVRFGWDQSNDIIIHFSKWNYKYLQLHIDCDPSVLFSFWWIK